MEWFEDLPVACPPSDATPCNGEYFRIAMVILRLHQTSSLKGNYNQIRSLLAKA